MKYYQSKKDVATLAKEIENFTHRSQITKFIAKKHQMPELGMFTSLLKDAMWLGRGGDRKHHQVKVSEDVMDFIINDGIFNDATNNGHYVAIYGKSGKGKLIDVVGFNYSSFVDPEDLNKY